MTLITATFIKSVILIFFWPAVIGAAIVGGLGPGVFASVLSVALADYFLIAPLKSFTLTDPTEVVPFVVFLVTSYLVSSLTATLRKERAKATEAALENAHLAATLDQQATELEQQLEESQSLQEELEASSEELIERTAEAEVANKFSSGILASIPDPFCLCLELSLLDIPFERQVPLPIVYKSMRLLRAYKPDLLGRQSRDCRTQDD